MYIQYTLNLTYCVISIILNTFFIKYLLAIKLIIIKKFPLVDEIQLSFK